MVEARLELPITPPFRLDLTAWVLRRRQKNAIDRWDGRAYSRILVVGDLPVRLVITQHDIHTSPCITIELQSAERLTAIQLDEVRTTVQKLLGLTVNVQPFYLHVGHNHVLERLARQFIGVRPPRFPTVFEALVNAIACQQVSLDVGILLLDRLAATYGLVFPNDNGAERAFPRPEDIAYIPETELKALGFSHNKARFIKQLAQSILDGNIDLDHLENMDNKQACGQLQAIHGIGRWSAEYVLLRGLERLDVFPGDDIGGQNNVQTLLQLESRPDYDQLKVLTATWQPYAGFVYFHLLLRRLQAKGIV